MTRRFLPVLFLTSATLFGAVPSLPEITARRTEITDAGTVFSGNARLDYDGAVLIADQISYDPEAQTARATGSVSLTRGSQRLLADELVYNLETRTYSVQDLRFGQAPLFVSGSSLEGAPGKIIIHDAVAKVGERPLGAVVPGDELYDALAPELVNTGVLLRALNERITRVGAEGKEASRLRRRGAAGRY